MCPIFQPEEDALPPEDIRFTGLNLELSDDGRRVCVKFSLTPFQQPPDIFISILKDGEEVTQAAIIEVFDTDFSFTMHIRAPIPAAEYQCVISVSYPEKEPVDRRVAIFTIPEAPFFPA